MALNDRISSARPLAADRHVAEADYAPMPVVAKDYRRTRNEKLFDAEITSARAVAGTPAQRCWMEREQVAQPRSSDPNIGGALIGGLVGGILGHQVGGGTGKDLATIGGAVGGAVVGSNLANQGGGQVATRDVQRCQNVGNAQPEYYDVVYFHNGVEHHVQMKYPPGPTIRVNARGEPRT
jgi:uncharacterized protein YcfJ